MADQLRSTPDQSQPAIAHHLSPFDTYKYDRIVQLLLASAELQGSANQLGIGLGAEGLWSFNGSTKTTVDDELGQNTKSAGHAEENSVVAGFSQAVVLQQNTRVGINVGVRVLSLAVLRQDTWSDLVDLADEVEHGIIGELAKSKFALRDVTRIGLAENCVAIARDDTTAVQGLPQVVGDLLVAEIVTNVLLHLGEPIQDFLVGQAVERSSETIETGRERQHGRAQGTTDQVSGVCADVSTLMIGVDGQV